MQTAIVFNALRLPDVCISLGTGNWNRFVCVSSGALPNLDYALDIPDVPKVSEG